MKLNKAQYNYRSESAARRNATNEQKAVEHGMTEIQAETISSLCALRHELHTNMDAVAKSDADLRVKAQLVKANAAIRESGLTPCPCIPAYEDDYIDIDDIDELLETEAYLSSIDKKYGTAWAPTGALRVF